MAPDHVQLSAFRKKNRAGFELRVVEVAGQEGSATVDLGFPVADFSETDLLGRKVGEVLRRGGHLQFPIQPWKIRTFALA